MDGLLPGWSKVEFCPFNDAHVILSSRMIWHIVKCKKNYDMNNYDVCPYNTNHYILKEKFKEHKKTCPDRSEFLESQAQVPVKDDPNLREVDRQIREREEDPDAESWDHLVDAKYKARFRRNFGCGEKGEKAKN